MHWLATNEAAIVLFIFRIEDTFHCSASVGPSFTVHPWIRLTLCALQNGHHLNAGRQLEVPLLRDATSLPSDIYCIARGSGTEGGKAPRWWLRSRPTQMQAVLGVFCCCNFSASCTRVEERGLCPFKVLLLLLGHLSSALPILQSLLTDKPRAVLLSKAVPDKG